MTEEQKDAIYRVKIDEIIDLARQANWAVTNAITAAEQARSMSGDIKASTSARHAIYCAKVARTAIEYLVLNALEAKRELEG